MSCKTDEAGTYFLSTFFTFDINFHNFTSSETQGQLEGAGKSLNGPEKNSGEGKSRTRRRAPGDKVLTDQFQTAAVVLASDWCHKTFVFLCPITEQQNQESFRVFLHEWYIQASCSPYLSGSFCQGFTRGEKFQSRHKCSGYFSPCPHETRLKYAGPFAGIVLTLLYLKFASFCTLTDVDKYFGYCFGQNEFFLPVFRTSIAVTETFPTPSNPSSHGPGRYVKHRIGSFAYTSSTISFARQNIN